MKKLNNRQKLIIKIIQEENGISTKKILEKINQNSVKKVARLTIIRDINSLLEERIVRRVGQSRGVVYYSGSNPWLYYYDTEKYLETGPDERQIRFENFNFNIFKSYNSLFSDTEKEELKKINSGYKNRLKDIPPVILQKEVERLTIEFVWKSSRIEGNTYSLFDTEFLIKESREAPGHSKFEATMILNQKKAVDYVFSNKGDFVQLDMKKIIKLHAVIIKELGVGDGIRNKPVGITGTKYQPLKIHQKIIETLDQAIKFLNSINDPLEKALLINLLIAYIQPFNDGNKRTSRLLGNAVLLAHDYCSLSFRSIDEFEYKKAILMFYEQNSARYFKELFVEQFRFAVDNYFL